MQLKQNPDSYYVNKLTNMGIKHMKENTFQINYLSKERPIFIELEKTEQLEETFVHINTNIDVNCLKNQTTAVFLKGVLSVLISWVEEKFNQSTNETLIIGSELFHLREYSRDMFLNYVLDEKQFVLVENLRDSILIERTFEKKLTTRIVKKHKQPNNSFQNRKNIMVSLYRSLFEIKKEEPLLSVIDHLERDGMGIKFPGKQVNYQFIHRAEGKIEIKKTNGSSVLIGNEKQASEFINKTIKKTINAQKLKNLYNPPLESLETWLYKEYQDIAMKLQAKILQRELLKFITWEEIEIIVKREMETTNEVQTNTQNGLQESFTRLGSFSIVFYQEEKSKVKVFTKQKDGKRFFLDRIRTRREKETKDYLDLLEYRVDEINHRDTKSKEKED